MKALGYKALLAAGLLVSSGVAWACADVSCYPDWKLFDSGGSCQDRGFLNPGNDTRVNLLFLLRDRGGPASTGLAYPKAGYDGVGYGQVFLDPGMQQAGLYPKSVAEADEPTFSGTRCASLERGDAEFEAALAANKSLNASERTALTSSRKVLVDVCNHNNSGGEASDIVSAFTGTSAAWKDFAGYLRASAGFYSDGFDSARDGFAGLVAKASDPWVREASAYMLIRTEYAVAQAAAYGEYGSYEPEKVDRTAVKRGLAANAAYLKTWPSGRYSSSAQGLVRRGLWLAGDYAALAREYERVLTTIDVANPAAGDLVFEIDNKWLFGPGASEVKPQGAMMLATQDLYAMRSQTDESGEVWQAPTLTAAQLDAQQPVFASAPDLYAFLKATHAFYIGKNPRAVLGLIPDAAKQASYTNLAFSRQVLRGQALAALKDRNEEGFWLDLLGGAKGLWQRPTVELGLAMNWERSGKLAQVFAKGSPITDTMIRRQLLIHSASPAMLRSTAADSTRGAYERDLATFVLLYKDLTRGQYAAFASDRALVRPGAGTDGYMYYIPDQENLPTGLFTKGKWSDGYACPALDQTAKALAANPQAVSARLCLGDFFRINGFDGFDLPDHPNKADELGGVANLFPGTPSPRSAIYTAIIADPAIKGPDKAYALYRAVMCYAPSGYNGCGGKDVAKSQRKAWYDQLKRDYPTSPWAKKLRYFW